MPLWHRLQPQISGYDLQIVQLPVDLMAKNSEYSMLGKNCDVIIGSFDEATTKHLVQAIPLGTYRFYIAMRSDHPLALKDQLHYSDLKGQTLLTGPMGVSRTNDHLIRDLKKKAPGLKLRYTQGRCNINAFNEAERHNYLMISLTPWKNIHPNLVSVPLATKYRLAYGILAPKQASPSLNNFMNIVRRLL